MRQVPAGASSKLVVGAELGQLERLAKWTEEFAQVAGLPSDLLFAIQLCLEEAVANIIMYSGTGGAREEMMVELVRAGADVVATIEDGGRHFDPTAVPPRHAPASIQEARVGGLGIHLMRAFAADMRYERREGRNRLTFTFSPARPA